MRILVRIALVVIVLFVVVIIGGIVFVNTSFPKVSAPQDIRVEITQERIDRG